MCPECVLSVSFQRYIKRFGLTLYVLGAALWNSGKLSKETLSCAMEALFAHLIGRYWDSLSHSLTDGAGISCIPNLKVHTLY